MKDFFFGGDVSLATNRSILVLIRIESRSGTGIFDGILPPRDGPVVRIVGDQLP